MRIEHDRGVSKLLRSIEEEHLAGGFSFTEGPIWIPWDNCLLFTDIPNNRIHRWRPGMNHAEVYREPSRHANGLTLDHDGQLLACEHSGRRVSRGAYNEAEVTLVDRFDGQRFNSPNDIVVHSSGAIYFTDPDYGLRDPRWINPDDPNPQQETPFFGVYRLAPDGSLTVVASDFSGPNGLAFSPDEAVLYIGDSRDKFIKRFRVAADGSLEDEVMFADQRDDERRGGPPAPGAFLSTPRRATSSSTSKWPNTPLI